MHVGSDEAGKGPVLGPMIVAAVAVPDRSVLPDGLADSKELRPARRETLAEQLATDDRIVVGTHAVTVERIDDPDTDMNSLTVVGHAGAIDAVVAEETLQSDSPPACVADAGDTSESRFARRVREACDAHVDLTARHGADADDSLVAAASIVAKVTRDERIDAIAGGFDEPIGSGYPSDPATREFLEIYVAEHGTVPSCARRSWSTCEQVLANEEQSGLGQF